MSLEYKNPLSSAQLGGTQTVARTSTFGTNFSVLTVGGYMEVYYLRDLELILTASTYPSNYLLIQFQLISKRGRVLHSHLIQSL